MCAVPAHFTASEVRKAHRFVLAATSCGRVVGGKVVGNPFVTYMQLAACVGYTIDDEYDGIRVGGLAGEISRESFDADGVMLSALVVSQDAFTPGAGFYTWAQELGLFPGGFRPDPDGTRELGFWNAHVIQIVHLYGAKGSQPSAKRSRP